MSTSESLLYFGSEVKALGGGRVAGFLVRYGDAKNTDLEGDFFTAKSDLAAENGRAFNVYYNHGQDGTLRSRVIGKGTVEAGHVLYINVDSGQREWQRRLRAMVQQEGEPEAFDLHFDWPALDAGGMETLEAYYADKRPRLIVIDTFQKVRGASNTRDQLYKQDYDSLDDLAKFARERSGLGVNVIHHTNKLRDCHDPFEQISGSTGLTAALDTGAVLRNLAGTHALFVKGKEVSQTDVALSRDQTTGVWVLEGDAKEFAFNALQQRILDTLRAGITHWREIADLNEMAEGTVRSYLARLKLAGRVHATGKGHYELSPASYLTKQGIDPFAATEA